MRKTNVNIAPTMVPSLILAQQASTSTQASAGVSATATTPRTTTSAQANGEVSSTSTSSAPSNYSAENRAKIDAAFTAARKRNLPEQPIRDRIAEGQAKGAGEGQVALAAQHAEARLEATQDAMIRAGRRQPSQSEVASGYQAMVHGASTTQIEVFSRRTPPDRSLSLALDAMTQLEVQGMAPDKAATTVMTSASGASSVTGAGSSATAGVTGAVGAVVKKPPTE